MYRSQTTAAYPLWSITLGYYPPYTWQLPQKNGYMSAHNNTALGVDTNNPKLRGGVTTTGAVTISVSTNTPSGQLIVTVAPGGAPTSIGVSTNSPLLTASIGGTGSTSIGISTNTPILGALGGMTVTATISVTTNNPDMLPVDDSPVLRTVSMTIGVDGTLFGHAIGEMSGTTADAGVTVDNVVNGVWNAMLTGYPTSGSAGNTLALAGSGGVDYTALANAVWTRVSRTLTSDAPPTVEQIATAVWDEVTRTLTQDIPADTVTALQATTIPVNITKVNNVDVDGTGSDADPWGPV